MSSDELIEKIQNELAKFDLTGLKAFLDRQLAMLDEFISDNEEIISDNEDSDHEQ